MNEHHRPPNLPEIPTRVVCQFQDGHRLVRIIDWNNRNAVKRFARQSRECLLSGPNAWTKTERIPTDREVPTEGPMLTIPVRSLCVPALY